jgi:hypothetical protein
VKNSKTFPKKFGENFTKIVIKIERKTRERSSRKNGGEREIIKKRRER